MADVFYPGTLAADPGTVGRSPLPNAVFQVFELTDTAQVNPLPLKDSSGLSITSLASTSLGVLPPVYVTSPSLSHNWVSGTWVWRRDSFDGAQAAVTAAKNASISGASLSPAGDLSFTTLGGTVIPAGNVKGPQGTPGSNTVPAQAAIQSEVTTPGTPTATALNATYLDKASAATTYAAVYGVPASLANLPDATSAVQAIIDSAATFGAQVYFPAGTYKVTAPLENFHHVYLADGAKITATAPGMAAVVRTRIATRIDGGSIQGAGIIDANTNAAIAIHLRNFLDFKISNIEVNGGTTAAVKLGDSTSSGRSAGAILYGLRIWNYGTVVTGSWGVYGENSGDNALSKLVIVNYEKGVYIPVAGNTMLHDVHPWNEPSKGALKVGFENFSNNTHYHQCHADSITQVGFLEHGYQSTFVQCGTYLNPSVTQIVDNTVVGIQFTAVKSIATIIGHFFFGGSSSTRLKSDISADDGDYGLIQTIGCSNQNVATSLRSLYNRSIGQIVRDTTTAGKGFIADAPTPANDIGLIIRTAGLDRWKWVTDGSAETGSNAGTGLALRSFTDTGALLAELLFISRASGTCVWKTNQSISDGFNITLGSTTGTKIGTNASQKLGFYGLAPVVQQSVAGPRGSASAAAALTAKLAALGLIADSTTTPIATKTTSYTITATDRYVVSNGGTLVMSLPDPTLASVGYPVTIKNVNASNCTVASLGTGALIDGAATQPLAQWGKITVISDGTQWLTV